MLKNLNLKIAHEAAPSVYERACVVFSRDRVRPCEPPVNQGQIEVVDIWRLKVKNDEESRKYSPVTRITIYLLTPGYDGMFDCRIRCT